VKTYGPQLAKLNKSRPRLRRRGARLRQASVAHGRTSTFGPEARQPISIGDSRTLPAVEYDKGQASTITSRNSLYGSAKTDFVEHQRATSPFFILPP